MFDVIMEACEGFQLLKRAGLLGSPETLHIFRF